MNILYIHVKFHVSWLKNDKDMIRFRIKMLAQVEILERGEVRVNFQDMTTIFFLEWFSIAKASSAKCQLISFFIAPPPRNICLMYVLRKILIIPQTCCQMLQKVNYFSKSFLSMVPSVFPH